MEVIQATERQCAITTLMLAFAVDPIMRWAWPDPSAYAVCWPGVADAFGGRAFDHGTAHGLGDSLAVALWLPPGVGPDEETVGALIGESVDERLLGEIGALFEQMEELHPSVDHWYLPLTGVDPPWQGQGFGSTLLRHALVTCDRDGLPAYLEATSPRSRDLYKRHGFNIVGVIQAGDVTSDVGNAQGTDPGATRLRQSRCTDVCLAPEYALTVVAAVAASAEHGSRPLR